MQLSAHQTFMYFKTSKWRNFQEHRKPTEIFVYNLRLFALCKPVYAQYFKPWIAIVHLGFVINAYDVASFLKNGKSFHALEFVPTINKTVGYYCRLYIQFEHLHFLIKEWLRSSEFYFAVYFIPRLWYRGHPLYYII